MIIDQAELVKRFRAHNPNVSDHELKSFAMLAMDYIAEQQDQAAVTTEPEPTLSKVHARVTHIVQREQELSLIRDNDIFKGYRLGLEQGLRIIREELDRRG